MEKYTHRVQYYETDKMGITHHSNYVRWMEEARVDFLDKIGYEFVKLEEIGIAVPVVGINCEYKESTKFNDEVEIETSIKEFKGVRLIIQYIMKNKKNNHLILEGTSSHCFVDKSGKIIRLNKQYPDFDKKLKELAEIC